MANLAEFETRMGGPYPPCSFALSTSYLFKLVVILFADCYVNNMGSLQII
jgi:hypothetical protein